MSQYSSLVLDIRLRESWRTAAEVRPLGDPKLGYQTPTAVAYDIDYAADLNSTQPAVSLRLPVGLEDKRFDTWPSFLFDLVPSGAARRFWMSRLNLGKGPHADWAILRHGAFNPPGRIRVHRDDEPDATNTHPDGFPEWAVIERSPEFLSYIEEFGGPVKGATGAGGDAPKYLLREDSKGHFHADLALDDASTTKCWLVKYPRGRRTQADREILQAEEIYARLARILKLKTLSEQPLFRETESAEALFVPRFDRVPSIEAGRMTYHGMESLYSAAGVCGWLNQEKHSKLVLAILRYSASPLEDFIEYVKRDLANMIFGNTDNHGRNTAFLIPEDNTGARLSPLFDFAPMAIDPEGIIRTVRWSTEKSGLIGLSDLLEEAASMLGQLPDHTGSRDRLLTALFDLIDCAWLGLEQVLDEAASCQRLCSRLRGISKTYLEALTKERVSLRSM